MLPHSPFSPLGNQFKYLSVLSITKKKKKKISHTHGQRTRGSKQQGGVTGGKRLKNCPVKYPEVTSYRCKYMRITSKSEKIKRNIGKLCISPKCWRIALAPSLAPVNPQTIIRTRYLHLPLTHFPAKVIDLSESFRNLISRYQTANSRLRKTQTQG